jgi:uncharacterized protein (TIGR03437 family)
MQQSMSHRAFVRSFVRLSGLVLLAGSLAFGQSVTVTTSPGNINLSYLQGAALPGTQTVAVKASAAATYTTTITPTGTTPTALWLTASPDAGTLPAKVVLHVNPTGLDVGKYTAQVAFAPVAASPPGTAGLTNVTLVVTAPPPSLTISPASLTFTAPPNPAAQTVKLATTGGPITFSADNGKVTWLTVAPASGVVLPGGPVTLTVTANPAAVSPSLTANTAKITLTEVGSASKTQTITVTLTDNYQQPTVTGIWPPTGKVNAPATTVTLRGTNFGAGSIAKIQGPPLIALSTAYISPTVINAVIPAAQMTAGTTLTIMVSNPAPGGDSVTTVNFVFTPTVDWAVNSASYASGGAPGTLIMLFGDNIGPTTAASLTSTGNYVDTTLGGVSVTIDGQPAAMVYVSQHQISAQIPYEAAVGTGKTIVVTNGANPAANGAIDITATSAGIFTVTGSGQAAALNTSATTGAKTVNSATTPAHLGDTISLYMTGEGTYSSTPTPVDGYIIPSGTLRPAMPQLVAAPVTVTIGGVLATVTYAGPFDDGMLGVLEVDAAVPTHTTGKAVPVVVSIGGNSAQAGVTIATAP